MPEEDGRIQFHWRARVKFELLPPFLKSSILEDLRRQTRHVLRGSQLVHEGRGWRVTYDALPGRLLVLDLEVW